MGEPRRCIQRHSRSAHYNQKTHRKSPPKHTTRGAEDSRVQTENSRQPKKRGPTPDLWGGRHTAHDLRENPEGALRDTHAGLTTSNPGVGSRERKTNTPRARQQHTINQKLKTGAKQTHNLLQMIHDGGRRTTSTRSPKEPG